MVKKPSIAFIGWNPFQFIHIKDLAKKIEGCVFVLEKRKDYIEEFDKSFFEENEIPVLVWEQAKMDKLDGIFDIIICQTPFFRIETFSKTKIIMIQYGYAKEPHNYGTWRSLADLCLTYGDYAKSKIDYFCPAISTGNPRFDKWHDIISNEASTKPSSSDKQTLLYVPTWGELSSFDLYIDGIMSLSDEYNVILKLHHNSDILEKKGSHLIANQGIKIHGANTDLLDLIYQSDVVISDYSGAIFDAVFFNKPIILLDIPIEEKMGKGKIDNNSLEFSHRSQLGVNSTSPYHLRSVVKSVVNDKQKAINLYQKIKKSLFIENKNACDEIIKSINEYWLEKREITQQHSYIRTVQKELLTTKRNLRIAAGKIKKLGS